MAKSKGIRGEGTLPLPFKMHVDVTPTDRAAPPPAADPGGPTYPEGPWWDQYLQAFYDQRKLYQDAKLDAHRSFDKMMVTISAGAFGLSIAFLTQLAGRPEIVHLWLLRISWFAFASSLITILGSFLASQAAWEEAITREDLAFENPGAKPGGDFKFLNRTRRLNRASIVTFSVGVFSFFSFAVSNF